MVQFTSACCQMRTFGYRMKKVYNHRVPIKYQRFMDHINPDDIVAHYSRDDIDKIDPRKGERTYKDAQQTMGRKNFLLPNLSDQDLELNHIFQQELDRQRAMVARISKIRVVIDSKPGDGTELNMNKDLSTPFDCARHIHDLLTSRSVVAEISPLETNTNLLQAHSDDKDEPNKMNEQSGEHSAEQTNNNHIRPIYWDMHRPLSESCRLKFRHFTDTNLSEVNKIYWRSCSYVLGMAIRLAFKDDIKVLLHSWPKPNVKSGSFVYDVALNLSEKWVPAEQELRAFTKVMWDIKAAALPFERIEVSRDVAKRLFATNPFKLAQIDSILTNESSHNKVTVYRCGGLLDISIGPMISNTSQIGRISLAAVHPFESDSDEFKGVFYRFQGVSLPQQLPVSSYIYQNILINQAKRLNKASL
uniref:39S ribosomal protein L39, mitochondrial n=1 Tax=Aceria tosichella TaxID=561515 RepID=A0A6G1SCR0_9ACAR